MVQILRKMFSDFMGLTARETQKQQVGARMRCCGGQESHNINCGKDSLEGTKDDVMFKSPH